MNRIQQIRNMMAENGMECTIGETIDLVDISERLQELAELPEDYFRKMIDFENKNHVHLYDAVMQIKYGRTA